MIAPERIMQCAFFSFISLYASQLSSCCLADDKTETPQEHSWLPPRVTLLRGGVTGAKGRGTWKHCP